MASYDVKEAFKFEKNNAIFVLKKLFLDLGSHKITMTVYFFGLIFFFITYLLNIYFVFTHLSLEITKYLLELSLMTYIMTVMLFSILLKKKLFNLLQSQQSFYWSYDSAGEEAKKLIWNKHQLIMRFLCFMIASYVAIVFLLMPFSGNLDQILLSPSVYEFYLHFVLAKICYFIYFGLMVPVAVYFLFRPSYGVWYFILQIRVQIFLINQHILQIENDFGTLSDWEKIRNEGYQEEMYKRLCYCMKQHALLKMFIRQFLEAVNPTVVIYIIEGTLIYLCLLLYIIFSFNSDDIINVVRLVFVVVTAISTLIVTSEASEMLQEETGRIFDVLSECPWHIWNIKVRKCLLIFLINSLEETTFSVAGVTLYRRLTINLLKAAYSYSMVFCSLTDSGF